ncbi:hypothetical protein B0J13DRAFT_584405 [Dactylonectria estremocensis]|uniref:NAD(P)-binding domain-containing protein n=1 Tax=Dactylonectria estremocensis TaxID=1079267 RepID=A0A9P9EWT6_9HYPO|nr:hypothetical protein B0J13DRAFT_584405 [Dactylonectria estremocensis]
MGSSQMVSGMGQVGRALDAGLVAHGRHKVHVLSPSVRDYRECQGDITFLEIDYDNPDAISRTLEDPNIDTVMCATGGSLRRGQQCPNWSYPRPNTSTTTRRFVISSYDMLHLPDSNSPIRHVDVNPLAKYTFRGIEEVEETDSLYTRVVNGWFLDYYGMPYWQTHLHPWINVVNGEEATFIKIQDLDRFVARLVDLVNWLKIRSILVNGLSLNDLMKPAQQTRAWEDSIGRTLFASEPPSIDLCDVNEAFFAHIHHLAGCGNYQVPPGANLNGKFPDIRLATA